MAARIKSRGVANTTDSKGTIHGRSLGQIRAGTLSCFVIPFREKSPTAITSKVLAATVLFTDLTFLISVILKEILGFLSALSQSAPERC